MKFENATKMATAAICGVVFASATATADVPSKPTYSKDIAPIVNANCVGCHRPGSSGPMSLLSYDEVRPWSKSISKYVQQKVMPPWHADEGFGPFKDARTLTDDEIATITRWVDQGAKQGNPSDLPTAPVFNEDGWAFGEPDYIFTLDEVTVPGNSPDQFHDLVHQTNFDEDKWLTAVQIRPGNSKVVHHVILWKGDGTNQTGWIDAWAAGAAPNNFPEGTGRILPKGGSIIADMHYHPAETDETDSTQVGLYFAKKDEVEKELVNLWVMNASFEIPPGDANYQAISTHTFAQDSQILSLTPHMHYRGKDFNYTATYPDGRKEELLKVSKYDFNWQTAYYFEEPVAAPKGTRIDCVAHFDNSEGNLANPDPTKTVRFGNQSYDEMMIGFVDYVVDEGVSPAANDGPVGAKILSLVEQHPGDIYKAIMGQGPTGNQISGIHLPRTGDGGWYIEFNGIAVRAALTDIQWTDNDFTSNINIPGQGAQPVSGSLNAATGDLTVKIQGQELTANRVD